MAPSSDYRRVLPTVFADSPPASFTQDRAYANLLGPLGETPTLWAECVFVDPVADLAVLREPDGQVLCDEYEAYETFMDDQATVPYRLPHALIVSRERTDGALD